MYLNDLLKELVAGAFGGTCLVIVGHPFDTIKVRLQTMQPASQMSASELHYSGTFDCFIKTLRNEGIRGLYKGASAPLLGFTPLNAICFFGYSLGRKLQTSSANSPTTSINKLSIFQIFNAGLLAGVFTTSLMAPIERVKCLLQIQSSNKKYRGTFDCARQLFKEGGLRLLYKGTFATLLRDVPSNGTFFATYEFTKRYLTSQENKESLSPGVTLVAGGLAGIAFWITALPIDVAKSRFQTAPEGKYNQLWDVYSELFRQAGARSLYKGFTPVIIRAFPANAANLLGYELVIYLINKNI